MKTRTVLFALGAAATIVCGIAEPAHAQVPLDIAEGLRTIGQVVDPACTARGSRR
jgi:hypothetical protein